MFFKQLIFVKNTVMVNNWVIAEYSCYPDYIDLVLFIRWSVE